MASRLIARIFVGTLLLGLAVAGCGRGRLENLKTHQGCPWCAPGRQVKEGLRSMGQRIYGPIMKRFWLDHTGREYDPEKVSKQVWDFLKATGDLAKIDDARLKGQCAPWMRIVSVNPIVVIQIPCQHKRFESSPYGSYHGTKLAVELSFVPDHLVYFDQPMQWISPDLKKRPTDIEFTAEGTAEIPLKNGKLKLVHDGDYCKISRE